VEKLTTAQANGSLPVAMGPLLRQFPGQWRSVFKNMDFDTTKAPLIVEIGCHTGHTICDMAQAFPQVLFVGLDITFKRVVQTAERARDRGLKNVFTVLANARGLQHLFASHEVDGFITFFPDPWTKKKHAHNRLYSNDFCTTVLRQLSQHGFLWLKTDHLPYFENACELANASGFRETPTLPVFSDCDFSSAFLRRFELKGVAWYGRKWIKLDS
jgi:tRNA (guanine-N7-)-methyltransferase